MNVEQAESLKLEIWKEIMRNKGTYTPGYPMSVGTSGAGGGSFQPPTDPVASAAKAVETFAALYPVAKPAKKRGR